VAVGGAVDPQRVPGAGARGDRALHANRGGGRLQEHAAVGVDRHHDDVLVQRQGGEGRRVAGTRVAGQPSVGDGPGLEGGGVGDQVAGHAPHARRCDLLGQQADRRAVVGAWLEAAREGRIAVAAQHEVALESAVAAQ
jgi:hypothetical protein